MSNTKTFEITVCGLCGFEIDGGLLCSFECEQDSLYLDERKPGPKVRTIQRTDVLVSEKDWTP